MGGRRCKALNCSLAAEGIALGISHAGFRQQHMAEFDLDAVANFPALRDGYSWEHYPWLPGGCQANSGGYVHLALRKLVVLSSARCKSKTA